MTNIVEYRNELCKEFIKNEESWLARSSNIEALKKSRKEKEKRRMQHKKNVAFFMAIAYFMAIAMLIIGSFGVIINIITPKPIGYYESRYDITYQTYTVKEGETLNGISKDIVRAHPEIIDKVGRFNYDDLLVEINGLDNPNRIYPGQEILYPVF